MVDRYAVVPEWRLQGCSRQLVERTRGSPHRSWLLRPKREQCGCSESWFTEGRNETSLAPGECAGDTLARSSGTCKRKNMFYHSKWPIPDLRDVVEPIVLERLDLVDEAERPAAWRNKFVATLGLLGVEHQKVLRVSLDPVAAQRISPDGTRKCHMASTSQLLATMKKFKRSRVHLC